MFGRKVDEDFDEETIVSNLVPEDINIIEEEVGVWKDAINSSLLSKRLAMKVDEVGGYGSVAESFATRIDNFYNSINSLYEIIPVEQQIKLGMPIDGFTAKYIYAKNILDILNNGLILHRRSRGEKHIGEEINEKSRIVKYCADKLRHDDNIPLIITGQTGTGKTKIGYQLGR